MKSINYQSVLVTDYINDDVMNNLLFDTEVILLRIKYFDISMFLVQTKVIDLFEYV